MPVTTVVQGRLSTIDISTDGITYTKIGAAKDCNLDIIAALAVSTNHDSGGWDEKAPANQGWALTSGVLFVGTDAAQDVIENAILNQTVLFYRFRPKVGVGNKQWIGQGYLKDWKMKGPVGDFVAVDISIEGTGPLTKSLQ